MLHKVHDLSIDCLIGWLLLQEVHIAPKRPGDVAVSVSLINHCAASPTAPHIHIYTQFGPEHFLAPKTRTYVEAVTIRVIAFLSPGSHTLCTYLVYLREANTTITMVDISSMKTEFMDMARPACEITECCTNGRAPNR